LAGEEDAAWSCARVFTSIEHDLSVDDDVFDPRWILSR
jgi:hypothetical protein